MPARSRVPVPAEAAALAAAVAGAAVAGAAVAGAAVAGAADGADDVPEAPHAARNAAAAALSPSMELAWRNLRRDISPRANPVVSRSNSPSLPTPALLWPSCDSGKVPGSSRGNSHEPV